MAAYCINHRIAVFLKCNTVKHCGVTCLQEKNFSKEN